jgi:ribosomal protein S27AE
MTDLLRPERWKCANCGATLAEHALGKGSMVRIKCRNCNFFNTVAVDRDGCRTVTCLPRPQSPCIDQGPLLACT